MKPADFLAEVRGVRGVDRAIAIIYNVIDDLLAKGDRSCVDAVLLAADPAALGVQLSLALLSITNGRDGLPSRDGFADRVRAHLAKTEPLRGRVERLLAGLVPVADPTPVEPR